MQEDNNNNMSAPWFKFYGGEYLSDPKMLALSASERSCWLTLLCYSSLSGIVGTVRHLSEQALMLQAGIAPEHPEWDRTKGVLKKFEELDMVSIENGLITVKNWEKRQGSFLTGYERTKRYRENQKQGHHSVINDDAKVTSEEIRVDKIRVDKKILPSARFEYLSTLPAEDMKEFMGRFVTTEKEIRSKAEDLRLYCERKGKTYRNYKSFLLNALKRDLKERDGTVAGGKYSNIRGTKLNI